MIVELNIFSGRPNPRWHLTGPQEVSFWGVLSRIIRRPSVQPAESLPDGLGYRGLTVTVTNDGISTREVDVYHQTVTVKGVIGGVPGSVSYIDEAGELQKFLHGTVPDEVSCRVKQLIHESVFSV